VQPESDGEPGGCACVVVALEEAAFGKKEDGQETRGLQDVHEAVGSLQGVGDGAEGAADKAGLVRDKHGGEGEVARESIYGKEERGVGRARACEGRQEAVHVDLESALMSVWQEGVDAAKGVRL
jgi:hypothetical protein